MMRFSAVADAATLFVAIMLLLLLPCCQHAHFFRFRPPVAMLSRFSFLV